MYLSRLFYHFFHFLEEIWYNYSIKGDILKMGSFPDSSLEVGLDVDEGQKLYQIGNKTIHLFLDKRSDSYIADVFEKKVDKNGNIASDLVTTIHGTNEMEVIQRAINI